MAGYENKKNNSNSGSSGSYGGGRRVYSNSLIQLNVNTASNGDVENVDLDEEYTDNSYLSKEFLDKYFSTFADMNKDGFVNEEDINEMQKILAGNGEGSYDVDGDGSFTLKDVTLVQKYVNSDSISGNMLNFDNNPNISKLIEYSTENPSPDEIRETLSNMTPEEYEQYVAELQGQYDEKITSLKNYKAELEAVYKEPMEELETALKSDYSDITGIQYGTPTFSKGTVLKTIGMTREEAKALLESMQSDLDNVQAQIDGLEKEKGNCFYFGLIYTKTYMEYKTPSLDDIKSYDNFIWEKSMPDNSTRYSWDYSVYKQGCGIKNEKVISPLLYCEAFYGYSHSVLELQELKVPNRDVLDAIIHLKNVEPDYYKTYCYYYDQNPDLADKYLEDMSDEILNVRGQYIAKEKLASYYLKDGDNDIMEGILNNLHVTADGLSAGVVKFLEGGEYSFEALLTVFGYEGTTQMSADEYASMYMLYALMSQNNKEKMGLIKYDEESGKYVNTDSESIIDFSLEYTGFALDKDYQISEGIGNSLPAVALSFVHPMAGTVAVGISSGGNAYHSAMLNGHDNWTSIMYGVFTGTSSAFLERKIGGLIGLSNTQVTSLKTYLVSIGKETAMGQISGLMDDIYRAEFMGEGFPETSEEWAAYFEQKRDMAIQSVVTAGVMNAPALGTSIYKKRKFDSYMKQNGLSESQIKDAINEFRNSNSSLSDLSDDEIKINYSDKVYSNYRTSRIKNIMNTEGVGQDVATVMFHTGLNSSDAQQILSGESNGIWVAGKGSIKLSNASQWETFSKYVSSGMSEHDALTKMLGDYDSSYASKGWLEKGDIESRVKKAYENLPDSDKNNLSYDDFLKIKLQLIQYNPEVHTPARYAQVKQQMQDSGSVNLVWSPKDLGNLLSGRFQNGIGRAANDTQDSATFAIPSSQLDFPDGFSNWPAEQKAEYLGTTLGLDSNNFKSGAYVIEIDESVYGNNWRYSDPYTQGSNQEYVPGMYTSSGLSEVIIPRIDDVVVGDIPNNIQSYVNAGDYDTAYSLFFDGIKNGTIKLKPGVTIKQI